MAARGLKAISLVFALTLPIVIGKDSARMALFAEDLPVSKVILVDKAKNEIQVGTPKGGKPFNMGEKLSIKVEGQVVVLRVTFPMMTLSKCVIEKGKEQFDKIQKKMPVYRGIVEDAFIDKHKAGASRKVGGMEFVYIHSGSFMMGSDKPNLFTRNGSKFEIPRHKVALNGFWIGKYEVTQSQYKKIMGKNPSKFKGDDNPVEEVTWNDAMEFCKKFGEKYKVKARLPYEAEWEYACRAGTTTMWYWGDELYGLGDAYLWHYRNSGDKTHPVGKKKPNAWGLHDMSGNVQEWCMDWFNEGYYAKSPGKNPQGPSTGKDRVIRGGAWIADNGTRSAWRGKPEVSRDYLVFSSGFRVVLSPE